MTSNHQDRFPDDLAEVAELLRSNRPEATALELDGVKRRVLARRAGRARGSVQKGSIMKSRLAMMAMLVVGLLMSGTGAGLAVSGLSSSGSAGIAQYGTTPTTPRTDVVPNDTTGTGDVLGNQDKNAKPVAGVQPTRQVAAGPDKGELPFTGFAAIPVLLGGMVLLAGGLFLRRRTDADKS